MIKINNVDIAVYPSEYRVVVSDIDNADTTTRTMDGLLHRDRIAVKRKIEMKWSTIKWDKVSSILTSIQNPFFNVTFPDPVTGSTLTREFYVGDRTAPVALIQPDGTYLWKDMAFNFIER
jgi:hypothetical protein